MNTSDTVYCVNSIGEVMQPWPATTLCKCMVGMTLKKEHVVAFFENSGMAIEAVTINHDLGVRQRFPRGSGPRPISKSEGNCGGISGNLPGTPENSGKKA